MPNSFLKTPTHGRQKTLSLYSNHLKRAVTLSVLLPPRYRLNLLKSYPLVLINDGQDFAALDLRQRLSIAYRQKEIRPQVIVGIHANDLRMREYGTSRQADYAGRGDLADQHRLFVVRELLPFLERTFRLRKNRRFRAIAGFSLGGLSAFDIAWNHELKFAEVACFSASFWWRSTSFNPKAPDENRIILDRIMNASRAADLHYHMMVGTNEEESDRNNNGIIDAIDDTTDVIKALRERGINGRDISYNLVEGGQHNQATWGPALLEWLHAYSKRLKS